MNVSGLLCGRDFIDTLGAYDADCYVLPRASLDYFGEKFLDSMTVEEAAERLGSALAFAALWSDVVAILERGPTPPHRNEAPNGAFWSPMGSNVARSGSQGLLYMPGRAMTT